MIGETDGALSAPEVGSPSSSVCTVAQTHCSLHLRCRATQTRGSLPSTARPPSLPWPVNYLRLVRQRLWDLRRREDRNCVWCWNGKPSLGGCDSNKNYRRITGSSFEVGWTPGKCAYGTPHPKVFCTLRINSKNATAHPLRERLKDQEFQVTIERYCLQHRILLCLLDKIAALFEVDGERSRYSSVCGILSDKTACEGVTRRFLWAWRWGTEGPHICRLATGDVGRRHFVRELYSVFLWPCATGCGWQSEVEFAFAHLRMYILIIRNTEQTRQST